MTVIAIDVGTENAMTIDTAATDARSIMLASVATIVSTVVDVEGKLSDTAKAWGANVFTLAYPADDTKPVTLDNLIGDSKIAAGWATIGLTDAGKKAKARMEVYFSNARLVAETFDTLSDDDKRDIRAGVSSIHYRAGLIRKAAADAKKAAKKEETRVAAETAAAAAKVEATDSATDAANPSPEGVSVEVNAETALSVLTAWLAEASADELDAFAPHLAALTAAYDARVNVVLDMAA